MEPSERPRVLIVDDEPMTCELIERILNRSGFEIVGTAHDGKEGIKLVEECDPDVVLLDLGMPGIDGISALSIIKESHPKTRVLVVTGHKESNLVREAIHRGASGYITKTDIYRTLPQTITNLVQGDIAIVEPQLVRDAIQSVSSRKATLRHKTELISRLTPREMTVLNLIAKGYDNQTIADKLFISYNTVKSHARSIFDKLSVPDRTQAALIALEAGLDNGSSN